MLRIAIVDDDVKILENLKNQLEFLVSMEFQVDCFESALQYQTNIIPYDLLFLDIDMPEMSGFELAEKLNVLCKDVTIIFMSHHEHLVYDTYPFAPFWFIRKSALQSDLEISIQHYLKRVEQRKQVFRYRCKNVQKTVNCKNIMYFQSYYHEITIYFPNQYDILDRDKNISLKSIAVGLPEGDFIKIDRSHLVNCRYIYQINRDNLELKNGQFLLVNPHNTKALKLQYQEYLMKGGGVCG